MRSEPQNPRPLDYAVHLVTPLWLTVYSWVIIGGGGLSVVSLLCEFFTQWHGWWSVFAFISPGAMLAAVAQYRGVFMQRKRDCITAGVFQLVVAALVIFGVVVDVAEGLTTGSQLPLSFVAVASLATLLGAGLAGFAIAMLRWCGRLPAGESE